MPKKKIDFDKYAAALFTRTEQYADQVRQHYATAVSELLKLTAGGDLGASGAFSFGDNTKLSEKANNILRGLYSAVYNEIKGGVSAEWEYANVSCDALIESIFGKGLKEDNHFARWFSRNKDAMDSFFARKSAYGGLNLSQSVWKYVGDLKTEMEVALSVSLGQGDSAATVSRKVRKYLQNPDMMFKRFRVKVGERDIYDEEGNIIGKEPIWGRRWKRKVTNPKTGAVTWENFNPRNYHSGRGVYRSSYKNAMRLTRTETNMAYRTAEQDRWQRMDFVVGYRVCLSNNHPAPDICDDLSAPQGDRTSKRGVYPKDFVFKSWHPQCRCYVIPILADENEFVAMQKAILAGEQPARSKKMIRKPNDYFYEWLEKNKDRIESANVMPYWMQDNQDYINKKRKIRVKTEEEREAIRKRWEERAKKNQQILKMATNVANVAKYYPEINLTDLQGYIASKNITLANSEARRIAKEIVAIKQDEKMLSTLIPDVHTWKQQFTSEELHGVYDAVQKKLDGWASLTLEQQEKKLKFEAYDFLGGNMKGVQQKYSTWKVSQAAYIKKHNEVLDAIDWQNIGDVLAEAKTFKTKSQPYLDLISQLETAVSSKDKADAQNIVGEMQAKRTALKKAADARKKKALVGTDFGEDAYTEDRKNNAVWDKGDGKVADDTLHGVAGKQWRNATELEKDKVYEYTHHYCCTNEPLQGRHYYGSQTREEFVERVDNITSYIDKNELPCDMWFMRGDDGLSVIASRIRFAGGEMPSDLEDLVGMVMQEGGFMSTGSRKGKGFSSKDVIMNIYAPKGTKAAYIEPISAFGNGAGRSWDGVEKFSSFSSEHETLFQRGTKMRITKVYKADGKVYIDCEVISQEIKDLSYVPDGNLS